MTEPVDHELMPKALPYTSGLWCERCELFFGNYEIAAGFKCVTPRERAKAQAVHTRRALCMCERRKARRDMQNPGACLVCGGDWLP